jgi:FtsP/CotA-like multicopper oxidase with cupredoxin domain
VTDYYYHTADYLVDYTKNNGPPPSDNVLFNGTNISPLTGKGKYANITLTPGKRHRLRIINTSVENHFVFSLANHTMTIIAADLVPVNAQTVNELFVGVGQRYDVTIDASQATGNYWFNATFVTNAQCGTSVNPAPAAVFHYAGAPGGLPTNAGSVATVTTCADLSNLVPVVQRVVSTTGVVADASNELNVTLDLTQPDQLFTWKINGTQMGIHWEQPVDQFLMNSQTSFPASDNVVVVNKTNQWIFWIIENDPTIGIAHPMHLHGHDFLVVGRADFNNPSTFKTSDIASFNGNNPVRRDVTMLPPLGWLAIAYRTDNPGTWLMHCHIAWHVSGGLAVHFVERPTDFKNGVSAADKSAFNSQCSAWNAYYPSVDPNKQDDSGLRKRGINSRFLGVGSFREQ